MNGGAPYQSPGLGATRHLWATALRRGYCAASLGGAKSVTGGQDGRLVIDTRCSKANVAEPLR